MRRARPVVGDVVADQARGGGQRRARALDERLDVERRVGLLPGERHVRGGAECPGDGHRAVRRLRLDRGAVPGRAPLIPGAGLRADRLVRPELRFHGPVQPLAEAVVHEVGAPVRGGRRGRVAVRRDPRLPAGRERDALARGVPLRRAGPRARLCPVAVHDAVFDQLARVVLAVAGLAALHPLVDGNLVGRAGALTGRRRAQVRRARPRQLADRAGHQARALVPGGKLEVLAEGVPVLTVGSRQVGIGQPARDEGHGGGGRHVDLPELVPASSSPAGPAGAGFRGDRLRGGRCHWGRCHRARLHCARLPRARSDRALCYWAGCHCPHGGNRGSGCPDPQRPSRRRRRPGRIRPPSWRRSKSRRRCGPVGRRVKAKGVTGRERGHQQSLSC